MGNLSVKTTIDIMARLPIANKLFQYIFLINDVDDIDDIIVTIFTKLYASEIWDSNHDNALKLWRGLREDNKSEWQWWGRSVDDDDCYNIVTSTNNDNRDGIIAECRACYPDGGFEIIEARSWNDGVQGDENITFAVTRNHEVFALK